MVRKLFENYFLGPPPKKGTKKCVKNEKNQSCFKLPEMAGKLVKSYFWILKSFHFFVFWDRTKLSHIMQVFIKW